MEETSKGYAYIIWSNNRPNVVSNKLDQAPKTTESKYQVRLDAIAQDIEKAFSNFNTIIETDDALMNRLSKHEKYLPLHKINEVKDGETLGIELKREKLKEESWGEYENPSTLKAIPNTHYGKCAFKVYKNPIKKIEVGERSIFLLITKEMNPDFPKNQDFKISAIEFSIPWTNTLLPKGVVYEKELTGEAFEKAVAGLRFSE